MSKGNPYGFWLLHFPSDIDGFRLLGFLVGLARDLGLCQPRPQPGPVSHDTTVQSGFAVTLNGSADAFGTNTYSSANVGMLVVDRGLAQCASGSATFIAAAESTEGSAFASAAFQLDIVGADFSSVAESHASRSDDTKAVDVASVQFAAIDLLFAWTAQGLSGCGNDDVFNDTTSHCTPDINVLDGNLAEFAVTSTAFGENTFVSVAADAIAVEDALSSSVVSATAAVDKDVAYTLTEGTSRDDRITLTNNLTLAHGNGGDDRITGGAADDWIFGDQGDDQLSGGGGDDTLLGGTQSDQLQGAAGDDWVFGGRGSDKLDGGDGNDLIFGNDDNDLITGGNGKDIISGGKSADQMSGGAGDDWFQLGASRGDGNDTYSGGAGADHYLIQDAFDRDVISDFTIASGDRLVFSFTEEQTEAISIAMQRSGGKDLVLTFSGGSFDHDQLVLGNFFGLNPQIQDMPRSGSLSHAQVATLLEIISAGPEDTPDLHLVEQTLTIGDMLAMIG